MAETKRMMLGAYLAELESGEAGECIVHYGNRSCRLGQLMIEQLAPVSTLLHGERALGHTVPDVVMDAIISWATANGY